MGRIIRVLFLSALLILPLALTIKRDTATETPILAQERTRDPFPTSGNPTLTPFPSPTIFDPENTPEPTPIPTATPAVSADVLLLLDIRLDIERMADDVFSQLERPAGWNGELDRTDPAIAIKTRSDIELLASSVINPSDRPSSWFGAVASTPFAIARDVRHDLERLADLYYGRGSRPDDWLGGDPLLSCNRSTQTLVNLLERGGVFRLDVNPNTPDFCRDAEIAVTTFTETQILGNANIGSLFASELAILAPHQVDTQFAVTWLDSSAVRNLGVAPFGTPFTPIARSYVDFSNMMLIRGDNFEVFVEYQNTTVNDNQFRSLPNVASLEVNTFCLAEWCQ